MHVEVGAFSLAGFFRGNQGGSTKEKRRVPLQIPEGVKEHGGFSKAIASFYRKWGLQSQGLQSQGLGLVRHHRELSPSACYKASKQISKERNVHLKSFSLPQIGRRLHEFENWSRYLGRGASSSSTMTVFKNKFIRIYSIYYVTIDSDPIPAPSPIVIAAIKPFVSGHLRPCSSRFEQVKTLE
ncbi:hypothetical protein VNO77_01943 [Canavalia gladiata]|uniref:Uncharacterized protein n=1 Tax=Canavalia gladiata TaxID=3824 RepID=A0AAN9RAT2_CANGL